MKTSWQKIDDTGAWGVKVSAGIGEAVTLAGQEVEVAKRDGTIRKVRLGRLVNTWNAGRAGVYEIADGKKKRGQPNPPVEIDQFDEARKAIGIICARAANEVGEAEQALLLQVIELLCVDVAKEVAA